MGQKDGQSRVIDDIVEELSSPAWEVPEGSFAYLAPLWLQMDGMVLLQAKHRSQHHPEERKASLGLWVSLRVRKYFSESSIGLSVLSDQHCVTNPCLSHHARCGQYRGFPSSSVLNWLWGQGHDFLWVTETLWIWGGGLPSSWSSCKCLKWPCYFLHCNSYNFLKSCRLMNLSN